MTSGKWQTAWRIYHAACQLPADQQQAFVESESADPDIARQVSDLLASLAEEENSLSESFYVNRMGTQAGRYQVAGLLGRGGMGEVYAAWDTDLGRPVALKFLRPEGIGDPAAVKRFVREAQAACALNHPNILTIYEVIDSSAGLAIAMELVEGDDLRSVRGTAHPAPHTIEIGKQIAQALAAAHQAGLIHRDIKPENILVRKDGYVKLVDFGLARHVASEPAGRLALQRAKYEGKDSHPGDTGAAGLAGTLRYMSPEQARGEAISPASDIFSFGLVLYEIATGQHAFASESPIGTIEAILTHTAAPPSSHNAAIPPELDRLVLRMLAKDAAARPSAEQIVEILADLERALRAPRSGPWARAGVWAAIGVLLAAGGLAVWRWPRTARPANAPTFQQVTTLVAENRATAAAIAPDGKWTAYANADGLFVQPTENNSPKPLQAPSNFIVDRLVWSADGTKLLASGFSTAESTPEVWVISATGDAPRLLRARARGATFSPDGTRIVFINEDRSEIWTMDAGGAGARKVLGGREELFLLVFWSADGRRLAYVRRRLWAETDIQNPETDIVHASRYESAELSTGRILAQAPGMPIVTAAPLSDGRILFVRANNPSGEKWGYLNAGRAVWEVKTDAATGAFTEEPRKIAEVENRTAIQSLSATADGRRIMVVKRTDQSTVFLGDFDPAPPRLANVRRIILDERTNYPHAWTRDSRALIFESDRNGNFDLFKQYLDRPTPETIVATPQVKMLGFPRPWFGLEQLAPDGRTVLFALRPDPAKPREFRLMRVPLEGGTPEFVDIGGTLDEFRCAVSGKRCVLRTAVAGQYFAFHELDPVRGKGRELARTAWSRNILGDWDLSADGMQVAIPNHYSRDASIRIVSLEPGPNQPRERELTVPGLTDLKGAVWAADGSGWFVTSDTDTGVQMCFVFPDGRSHLLGDIQGWAVPAPDGRRVAFVNRSTASNAWVLDRQGARAAGEHQNSLIPLAK